MFIYGSEEEQAGNDDDQVNNKCYNETNMFHMHNKHKNSLKFEKDESSIVVVTTSELNEYGNRGTRRFQETGPIEIMECSTTYSHGKYHKIVNENTTITSTIIINKIID